MSIIKNQSVWYHTFPTMLPMVMMDPLGAPQATRAWATACVTKKEPCNKHKGEAKTDSIDNNREHRSLRTRVLG